MPASLELALSSADPTDDGSGLTEPTDIGYARQTIVFSVPVTTEPDGSRTSNTSGIVFTGTALGVVTHAAIFDNSGNMLFYGALDVARDVINNDSVSFAASTVRVTLAGAFSKLLGEAILNWTRGVAMRTAPASLELAIGRASATRDGNLLNEVAGNNYYRQTLTFGAPSETVGVGTSVANDTNIIFGPNTTVNWGAITDWAIFMDGADDMAVYGTLAVAKNVTIGAGFGIATGALTLLIR